MKISYPLKTIFTAIIFTTIIGSCKPEKKGPCEYDIYDFKAKVESIEAYEKDGRSLFHVGLKFDSSTLKDTIQYLEELRNFEIDSTYMKVNKVQVGGIYTGNYSEIKIGNCEPSYLSFDYGFKHVSSQK